MSKFAIMRCVKIKTLGSAAGSLQHTYRERKTDNADPERTGQNVHYSARSTDEALGRLREKLPEKRRKDATLAIEYMMTASPEWMQAKPEALDEWSRLSRAWLEAKYGAENVISCTLHMDETTPHLTAMVIPITTDGRLAAKHFIGSRQLLTQDQTSYAAAVAALGLERGIEKSEAKHSSIKAYYARIHKAASDAYDLPVEPQRPVKPVVAPEPPVRHWWGAETGQHKAWRTQEVKKASQYQFKVKAWAKEHQSWRRQVHDLAATALALSNDAHAGREAKRVSIKSLAAERSAKLKLEQILATPGVTAAVQAHKAHTHQNMQDRMLRDQREAMVQQRPIEPEKKPAPALRQNDGSGLVY